MKKGTLFSSLFPTRRRYNRPGICGYNYSHAHGDLRYSGTSRCVQKVPVYSPERDECVPASRKGDLTVTIPFVPNNLYYSYTPWP